MKVHIKKVCLAVFCIWGLAICAEALAYTEVCGHIDANTIWDTNGSPYVLICKVFIDPYVTLKIQPDVVVVTRNSPLYILEVNGSLDANGASFPPGTPDYPNDYPDVTYSLEIHVEDNGSVGISDCDISDYIYFEHGSSGTLDGSTVDSAVIFEGVGEYTITDCNFTNEMPYLLRDLDVDTSGINGNTYNTELDHFVGICGGLVEDKTMGCIDTLCKYKLLYIYLQCSGLTIGLDAELTILPGVEIFEDEPYGRGNVVIVYGSLKANSVLFSSSTTNIKIHNYGSINLQQCVIEGLVDFYSGSTGTITNDTHVYKNVTFENDSNGTLNNSTIDYVIIQGAGTRKMFGNTTGHINLWNDAMAGCMADNKITESGPFRIINGIGDTSGICGNIYEGSDPNILISGNFKNDCKVGFIDSMGDYRINADLTINSGARVTFSRDTRFEAESTGDELHVEGSMAANGVMFSKNIRILTKDGGSVKLWHCDVNNATSVINCKTGSSGILEYCRLNQLYIDSGASFSIVNNDFSYSSVNDIVVVPGNPDDVIDMNDNWWGTTDANEIEEKILHHPDDEPPIRPWVYYEPFLQEPPPGPPNAGAGDFEPDGDVEMLDLRYFVAHWLESNCGCSNWCSGTDLDQSWFVNFADFAILADNWLAGL